MHLVAQPHTAVGAKQEVNRHWLTAAGVVVVAAGMIAAAPGTSPAAAGAQADLRADSVRLTAGWDPLAPWQAAFDTAAKNGEILGENFLLAPGVGLQQAIVNQLGYAKQMLDDPSSFESVATQFAANVVKVASGLTLIGADEETTDAALKRTLGGMHGMMFDMLPGMLPESVDPELVGAVMNVLASPLSGVAMGFAGPAISPAVALINSAVAISAALQSEDPTTALSAALNVPANVVNGFLNGATLNLDALAPVINDAGVMPTGISIGGLSVAFGGLLTPGNTDRSPYEVKDENGKVIDTIDPVGGSMFNSLGLVVKLGALPIEIKPEAIGPIGAMQGLSQTVGVLLGSGWDDYDGKGNAPAPKPPLVGLDPMVLGDPLSDIAESAGLTKLRENLKSLAVDKIVKQLQGLDIGTEAAADEATAVAVSADTAADSATSTGVAAANELTHATANKTVALSVEKPAAPTSTKDATTTATADEAETTDETAGATTESADEAEATAPKAPKAQIREKSTTVRTGPSSNGPQRNLVKGVKDGVKDAVKNVRNGLSGNKSRTSNESGSSSSDSSTGSSSSKSSAKKADSKSDSKKDKKDSGKE